MNRFESDGYDYYKMEIDEIPSLKYGEETFLLEKIKKGDSSAKERLFLTKLRLVHNFVTRVFSDTGICLEDLIQEGNISLMSAIDSYDPAKGISLSQYACVCIYRHILRNFSDNAFVVQLPVLKSELALKILKYQNLYKSSYGMFPSAEELCNQLNISVDKYISLEKYINIMNFDELLYMEEKNYDEIVGYNNVEDVVLKKNMKEKVQMLVNASLSPCDKDILIKSLNLGGEFSSLRSLGKKYGLSHGTIDLRKKRSLQYLKKVAIAEELNAYLTDSIIEPKVIKK